MKKLLGLLFITTIALNTLFASSENKNILMNGTMEKEEYTFSLFYNNKELPDGSAVEDTIDFSIISTTKPFILKRTAGNLNKDLEATVSISASSFIGKVNGNEIFDTGIIPLVTVIETNYNYTLVEYSDKKEKGKISLSIASGRNKTSEAIAAFYFTVNGNGNIPAGNYKSTININYTYIQ